MENEPIHRRLERGVPEIVAAAGGKGRETSIGRVYFDGVPFTPEQLRACEEALGCRLPTEYAEFLFECNGGCPEVDMLIFESKGEEHVHQLAYLYGVATGCPYQDLVEWHRTLKGLIPRNCVAFGGLVFEYQLLFRTSGPRAGEVLIWEPFAKDEAASRKAVVPVAAGFREFTGMLSGT